MTYYIYHIPGKKIGVTRDLNKRVTEQQGYEPHEYEILEETEDIDEASYIETMLQVEFGYRVDEVPYNELKFNNKEMNINITEATTTFPCPANKLKGRLMDNIGMSWETDHGDCVITKESLKWIMKNVQTSRYNSERCYVYNKAFARYYDNNNAYQSHDILCGNLKDMHMRGEHITRTGALSPTGVDEVDRTYCDKEDCECKRNLVFHDIRQWASTRGLYDKGDPKTQYLKLMEEAGELGRALLKNDHPEQIDAIGDIVVVLTNLSELIGVKIEDCIDTAYNVIAERKGKMINGTFVKDE